MSHITQNMYRTAFVCPSFIDSEDTHQFSTIQAAIDWQHNSDWYAGLSGDDSVAVIVYPGTYREQLTCWAHIAVSSIADADNFGWDKTVQIHPAVGSESDPILVSGEDYIYNFSGCMFIADSVEHGPYAYSTSSAKFYNCIFDDGTFLDGDAAYACSLNFAGCTFNAGTNAFNFIGARGHGTRSVYMLDTWGYGDIIMNSTFISGTPRLEMRNCAWVAKITAEDTWAVRLGNTRIRNWSGGANRNTFDTTGIIEMAGCIISGGIHFASAPAEIHIEHCDFNEVGATAITGADITSDVTLTNVDYMHNLQQNGIAGEIRIVSKIKNVGGNAINRYYSIQDAIDSVATVGIIELYQDYASLSELTITGEKEVTIDGRRAYGLTFSSDIIEVRLNQIFRFSRLQYINGGVIEINGNNAEVYINDCDHTSTYSILITSGTGSFATVIRTKIVGATGLSPLQINSINTTIVIEHSTLIGATGQPAVEFSVEADDLLKSKFSTFIHGDGGVNSPFENTSGADINIAVYSCGLNAAWAPPKFTNTITAANNTTDPQIDF